MYQLLDNDLGQNPRQFTAYGSFLRRLAAALIDGIIMMVVQTAIFLPFGKNLVADASTGNISPMFWVAYLLVIGANVAYYSILESSEKQGTFGKQAMGLVVTDINGERISTMNAMGRYFAKIPSGLILAIGFLMQPFTQKKQALHDIIAGTLVFKK
jgi:uncharacterized RDD family membrane protein YckC